ncbi:MAG: lamin tail domain-containing protein, partial [Sedimentisphaerales bacterium]|nr:lamin tail domain-containing protein [Sedimentisphaerales bacterium]
MKKILYTTTVLVCLSGLVHAGVGAGPAVRGGLGAWALLLRADTPILEDVTSPGDPVQGVPNDGDWPGAESPPLAIDNNITTKYLHFKGETQATGFQVTPSKPGTYVSELTFTTANDAPDRDPVAFALYGSNTSINGPWTFIASGPIVDFDQDTPWPRFTQNATPIQFVNYSSYDHYQLLFTAVRNPWGANSMQIAEVEFLELPADGWPPQANAGQDRVLVLPNTTLTLDGSVEDRDTDPNQIILEWSLLSAPAGVEPGDVTFTPGTSVLKPVVELPGVAGEYVFQLTADDGDNQDSDTVRVTIVKSLCPVGDLNSNCVVEVGDLQILLSNWLRQSLYVDAGRGDLNGKDGVNLTDYSLMMQNWAQEGPSVVINEFLTLNKSKYPAEAGELWDEDNESSDWIELYNISGRTINLKGWYLTNDPQRLDLWEFPDVSLEPRAFLVVFASGKDRDDPDSELHTNFTLSVDGGFLAVVKPDAQTIVHHFDYTQQFGDVSYGLTAPDGTSSTTVTLLPEYAPAYALVPENGNLGLAWTGRDFDHSGWEQGTTGVGYDYPGLVGLDVTEMYGENQTVYVRIPFTVDDLSNLGNLTLSMKYDDGFIAYLNNGVPNIIAQANDPENPDWESGATQKHDDDQAVLPVDFLLPDEDFDYLQTGTNVLAIHGLNESLTSTDLLILPKLTATRQSAADLATLIEGFFPTPTPGQVNHSGVTHLGPAIRHVTENPTPPLENESLVITAQVSETFHPVGGVMLNYRIGFGPEINDVAMTDDGAGADAAAGDGIYTAVIPESAYIAGDMVRWYVTAVDTTAVETREPLFLLPDNSPEYFGTVVVNPAINTNLPVYQYFVQNVSAAGTRTGTRCSVFFLDEFYDNVFIRLRGANTTHGRKFEFNDGHHFLFDPDIPRVDEINLNEQGADSTTLRQTLAWETYVNADAPGCLSFLLHVRRNGYFHAVRIFVEQPDRDLLRRNDLDPDGALYKLYTDFTHGNISDEQVPRKKTRLDEDYSDLQALANGINPSNPNRFTYMFDNVNIPAIIEYWAATVIIHDNDQTHKNYYGYRDTRDPRNNPDGTNEWLYLPWDKDLTFGVTGIDNDYPGDIRSPSHPFYGCNEHQKIDYKWNGLIDALFDNPVTREMYLRRLRTLMDDLLQAPGTPADDLKFEKRIDELKAASQIELGGSTWNSNVEWIKSQYMVRRRQHLFVNHSIHNPGYDQNAGIPDSQVAHPTITIGAIEFNPASYNQDEEYIELVNPNAYAVDITGWTLDDAVEHTFPPGTVIPAGGSMYVSPDAFSFRNRSVSPKGGEQRFVQGNYQGHLSSWGETIRLLDAEGVEVDSLGYHGTPTDQQRYLRITEMMYHPSNPPSGSGYNDEDFEYVELQNIGSGPLSLDGVTFTDGIVYAIPAGTSLDAGEYLLLAKNPAALVSRYTIPGDVEVLGPYAGQLSNSGEVIKMEDYTNSTILDFEYKDGWYEITDGLGFSLTVCDPNGTDPNDWDEKDTWRASLAAGGSPGTDDSGFVLPPDAIRVNELLAHASLAEPTDWVEFYNTTTEPIHI